MDRLARFWASVRPRTRRGAVLATVAVVAGAAAVSVVLTVGVTMAWSPYVTYGLDSESNARDWAHYELAYADSATCGGCHEPQVATVKANPHQGVSCESCHTPLAGHVAEAEASPVTLTALEEPTDETCQACHLGAAGRPADFPVVDTWQHYKPVCLECHDPHTGISMRPPAVLHPLDNLPDCITCHGPDGFKARNQRHPDDATDDAACLECHAKGRGPLKEERE
jgi:nitrate/TMAO reductase-like tetraheme cytochrome c subunit